MRMKVLTANLFRSQRVQMHLLKEVVEVLQRRYLLQDLQEMTQGFQLIM